MMQTEAYWENLVKRSICRFLLLSEIAKGPVHGYGLNQAIRAACQGCCEPTEAMVYSTMRELIDGGYVTYREEEHQGRRRRVCWLTSSGTAAFQAAARVWEKMLPKVEGSVALALSGVTPAENGNYPDYTETTKLAGGTMTANPEEIKEEEIKQIVRERYGAKARGVLPSPRTAPADSNQAACCAPGCCGQADEAQPAASEPQQLGSRRAIQLIDVTPTFSGDAGCCGPEDLDRALKIYQAGQLAGLPAESVAASAGCGNPTALAGLQRGERVLDLGSGGGIDCFLAAQQVGEEGHVTGLDMTPDMLELARKNQATLGLKNVEFVQGEMEKMPLPESSVDVIISNCVVCLSPDKDAVFQESFRVLAPGGRIHLSDMMSLSSEGPSRTDAEAWASCIAGAEDQEVYLARLRRAGFVDIEITEETVRFDETEGAPLNVASVKVVANKPE